MNKESTWNIDPVHSTIGFAVPHLMVAKVRGSFKAWSAELTIDEADITRSSVAVMIEAASIDTGNAKRDGDLRSDRFFDAEKYPTLTFRSRRIERTGGEALRITGDLTILGVTKEVVLDAELGGFANDPWGCRRAGFTARTTISRDDFGMVWNQVLEAGGVFIGNRVEIGLDIEAVSKTEAQRVA